MIKTLEEVVEYIEMEITLNGDNLKSHPDYDHFKGFNQALVEVLSFIQEDKKAAL